MNRAKLWRGFTIIEVAIFLAVTGLLFVSVTVGVQNSIFQQRFNDSVQNFAEFLRNIYAETMNVQNTGGGRSEYAIYGKLVTFGEEVDLNNCPVNNSANAKAGCTSNPARNAVFVYNVIGNVGDIESGNIISSLVDLNVNVVIAENHSLRPVGIVEDYVPRWGAHIESTNNYSNFRGAVIVLRHPRSGNVYTFIMKGRTLNINKEVANYLNATDRDLATGQAAIHNLLVSELQSSFSQAQADFCINPNAGERYSARRDVIITKNARNSSGVVINATDNSDGGNQCNHN